MREFFSFRKGRPLGTGEGRAPIFLSCVRWLTLFETRIWRLYIIRAFFLDEFVGNKMLICLFLCAAAVLPTAFSERPEAQNVQPQAARNNEMTRKLAAGYAAARNQGLLRYRKFEEGQSAFPLADIYMALEGKNPELLRSAIESEPENDLIGKNGLLSRFSDRFADGRLLRREAVLDSIGGGHLLKRDNGFRALDPIGGGNLLKRDFQLRQLDAIGGGHLLKRDALDSIGGGHLLKRNALESVGGGHLLKRYSLDSIGGGNLLRREFDPRQLYAIGGGRFLEKTVYDDLKKPNVESYAKYNEAMLV